MKLRRIISIVLIFVFVFVSTVMVYPAERAEAAAAGKVTVSEATARLNELTKLLNGKYFTVNAKPCNAEWKPTHDCNNCLSTSVIKASWLKNLVGRVPSSIIRSWSCVSFTHYAGWYIFSEKASDTVTFNIFKTGKFSYDTLKAARPGDRITFNKGHSVIFVSCDSSGMNVLDSNWNTGKGNCIVSTHKIGYNSFYKGDTITIRRASNYDVNATSGGSGSGNNDNSGKVSVTGATTRLDELTRLLEGKFFTVNAKPCNKPGKSGHGCNNCNFGYVLKAQWIKDLVKHVPSNLEANFYHWDSEGKTKLVRGWSCAAFANYAGWYIFSKNPSDTVTFNKLKTGKLSYDTIKNARPGDLIRLGGNSSFHSVVFVSCDQSSMTVLDCNWNNKSPGNCKVSKHKINFNNGTYKGNLTISRASNYDVNSTVQEKEYDIDDIINDSAFKAYVKTNFDKNNNNKLSESELRNAKEIRIGNKGCNNLDGIEYFTDLIKLDCCENNLKYLDVSKNTKLEWLWCYRNQLPSLNLSANKSLKGVFCGENYLTEIDISNNKSLEEFRCDYNQISKLDLSNNPQINYLWCAGNKLTSLDLSNQSKLKNINIGNQFTGTIKYAVPRDDSSYVKVDLMQIRSLLGDYNFNADKVQLTEPQYLSYNEGVATYSDPLSGISYNYLVGGNQVTPGVDNVMSVDLTIDLERPDVFDPPGSQSYIIYVTDCVADKYSAKAGEIVTITANTKEGEVFSGWGQTLHSNGIEYSHVSFADSFSETTTFVMPAGDVNIFAMYKDVPSTGVSEVKITPTANTLTAVGQTFTVTATVEGGITTDKRVKFTSSNPAVATVDPSTGVVKAVANGTTTITATSVADSTKKAVCTVKVEIAPIANKYKVSGTIKSYGNSTEKTAVELLQGGIRKYYDNKFTTSYLFDVMPGTYTMKVMKKNHVERKYTVEVNTSNVTQDVKICLLGDVNGDGKVNSTDVSRLYAHVKNINLLRDEYEIACADVIAEGKLNSTDVSRLYAHAKGTSPLW